MSLADGDYIIILSHVLAAINADTGSGGLKEAADPPVKTVESEIRHEPRVYRDHEAPAIAVVVKSKEERRDAGAAVRNYRLAMRIYCRGLDAEVEIARCRRIAGRLEALLREENSPARQLAALPGSLTWSIGSLELTPSHTEFTTGEEARQGQMRYAVVGVVEVDLSIPAVCY